MVLLFLLMLVVLVIAGIIACFGFLPVLQAIFATVIGVPLTLWLGVLFYGLVRRAQPLRPFDAAKQKQSGVDIGGEGRYITTSDGRIVEYLVTKSSTEPSIPLDLPK